MEQWVANELKTIKLGDKRLNNRLGNILDGFCSAPDKSIPVTFESWGELIVFLKMRKLMKIRY